MTAAADIEMFVQRQRRERVVVGLPETIVDTYALTLVAALATTAAPVAVGE